MAHNKIAYTIENGTATKLYRNGTIKVLLDEEDAWIFDKYELKPNKDRRECSIIRSIDLYVKKKYFKSLHRFLLKDIPHGMVVDHINRNPLDNRKCNLRICTNAENSMNSGNRKHSRHNYKGITHTKQGKFRARICFNNQRYQLGVYNTPEEAAKAYDLKAIELFGEFACLNFS